MRQVCSKTIINMIKQFELDREKLLDMKILLVSTDPPTYLTLEHSRFENRFFYTRGTYLVREIAGEVLSKKTPFQERARIHVRSNLHQSQINQIE